MNKTKIAKTLLINVIIIAMLEITIGGIITVPWLLVPAVVLAVVIMLEKTEIKVKYFNGVTPIEKISVGDWIDLRASERVEMKAGEFKLIPLGVAMKLPDGYEAIMAPRSSTLKKFGIIQGNSIGVIDNSYSGDADEWLFPAVAFRDTVIEKDDRICQFRIVKNQPSIKFKTVFKLSDDSRGGFGSTGTR